MTIWSWLTAWVKHWREKKIDQNWQGTSERGWRS